MNILYNYDGASIKLIKNDIEKEEPMEIKYIKDKLKTLNIKFFIDVHNDEITKENYII